MCTAISFVDNNFYFGRTLDVEFDVLPSVVITPRNYTFTVDDKTISNHYAIIGMALPVKNYPLYFEGANEVGLAMAGLNFPDNAVYYDYNKDKLNVSPSNIILYILSTCKSVAEAKLQLGNISIENKGINDMPTAPLHWLISDNSESITVEQTADGLKVYENPVGVLTNNPKFSWHLTNVANYLNLTSDEPANRMLKELNITPYCKGMGAIGLPGDLSSASRFIRATFAKFNAKKYGDTEKSVHQFFHILGDVSQTEGLAKTGDMYERTLYTSCIDVSNKIYYYTTYFNSSINAVKMVNINCDKLTVYQLKLTANINCNN